MLKERFYRNGKCFIKSSAITNEFYIDEAMKHTIGVRISRYIKKGDLIEGEDYIRIGRDEYVKHMDRTDISYNPPIGIINCLSESGYKKVFGYELEKKKILEKDFGRVYELCEFNKGELLTDKNEVREVSGADMDGVRDAILLLADVIKESTYQIINTIENMEIAIGALSEGEKEEEKKKEEEEEEKAKKEKEKEEEEEEKAVNNIIEFKGSDMPEIPPVIDQRYLRSKKDDFYHVLDALVRTDPTLKDRHEGLSWIYGKLTAVYGLVFDQLRKELVPEYDNHKYSRVDLLCLSTTFYDIAINTIGSRLSHLRKKNNAKAAMLM